MQYFSTAQPSPNHVQQHTKPSIYNHVYMHVYFAAGSSQSL